MTSNPLAKWLLAARWIAVVVSAASVVVIVRSVPTQQLSSTLSDWIASLGVWGPVVLALVYIVATILLVPGTILSLAAGAMFGLTVGTISVSIGSTLGAAACFLIARYAARDRVTAWARRYPRFGAIDGAIGEGGWKIVALLRLSPAIPFNVQNYLYGLTPIRFWPYVITSWIAMLPGTFLYVYLGHITKAALNINSGRTPAEWVFLGIGLLATVIVSVYIAQLARAKIREQVEGDHVPTSKVDSSANEITADTVPRSRIALTTLLVILSIVLVVLAINSNAIASWIAQPSS